MVPGLIRDYIQQVQDDLRFITASPGGARNAECNC